MRAMNEPMQGWVSPQGAPGEPTLPSYGGGSPEQWPAAPGQWQTPPGWGHPRAMEVKPGVVPLRPLGLGELLDGAVGLIRRYPRPVLGLSAALAIVVTVVNVTLVVTVFRPLLRFDSALVTDGSSAQNQLDGLVGGTALGGIASTVVTALATIVLTGVMTAVAGRGVLGQSMTLAEAWAQVRPALGRLIGLALLTALLVYGSLMVGIVVAVVAIGLLGGAGALIAVPVGIGFTCLTIYLYCRLALAPSALLLENAGVRTSLRRSGILVRRSWWRVFGVLLLALVVASIVGQLVQLPFLIFGIAPLGLRGGAALVEGTTRLLVLSYIGAGIAQTVIAPFTAGVRALLYVDRRMRAEGLDVALTAAAAPRPA
jgi:hypothetical protein